MTAEPDPVPQRRLILVTLLLGTGMVAMSSTIVATAVPTIVDDLGGLTLFPWLFSVYQLCMSSTIPIYSKLADRYGRKPLLVIGLSLYLVGTLLAGVAGSMPALIVFRAVQGLGAGAIQPISTTIAADIFPIAQRARVQGYTSSTAALAQIIGPAVGGLIVQFGSWRWMFALTLVLGAVALFLLCRNFRDQAVPRREPIDIRGALLLPVTSSLLLLGVLGGGQYWAWDSVWSIGCFGLGAAAVVGLAFAERGVPHAVLPGWLFRHGGVIACVVVTLGVGATLMGVVSYVPLQLQLGGGVAPLVAGVALAGLSIGWMAGANVTSVVARGIGFRWTSVIGLLVAALGTGGLAVFSQAPHPAVAAASCAIAGIGIGFASTSSMVAAQLSVEWGRRAVTTGAVVLGRSLGNLLGAAVFGAIANATLAVSHVDAATADPATIGEASRNVFIAITVVLVLTLPVAVAVPSLRPDGGPVAPRR
jgi:MFS family permease